MLLEFLTEALESSSLRVLLHQVCVSLDLLLLETRRNEGNMAEARHEMVQTRFGPHVFNVRDPVLAVFLRDWLDRKGLLRHLMLETLVVLVRLDLEVELAKDRHHELFAFYFRDLGLLLFEVRVRNLACSDDLVKVEGPFALSFLESRAVGIPSKLLLRQHQVEPIETWTNKSAYFLVEVLGPFCLTTKTSQCLITGKF